MFVLMFVFHINIIKDRYIIFNTSQLFFIVTCTKRIYQKSIVDKIPMNGVMENIKNEIQYILQRLNGIN